MLPQYQQPVFSNKYAIALWSHFIPKHDIPALSNGIKHNRIYISVLTLREEMEGRKEREREKYTLTNEAINIDVFLQPP